MGITRKRLLFLTSQMCSLFLDNAIGKAEKEGLFENEDEKFGAVCFATRQFQKAYKILKTIEQYA